MGLWSASTFDADWPSRSPAPFDNLDSLQGHEMEVERWNTIDEVWCGWDDQSPHDRYHWHTAIASEGDDEVHYAHDNHETIFCVQDARTNWDDGEIENAVGQQQFAFGPIVGAC